MKTILNKNTLSILFISTNVLFVTLTAHAEIYKWKDAKGITHYTSQKPIKKTVKAENIEAKIRFAAGKYRPSTEQKSQKPKNTSNDSSTNTQLSGPSPKLITYCKGQRENLAQLKQNYRNTWKDKDGKVSRLDQKQRQIKVDQIQKSITKECAGI